MTQERKLGYRAPQVCTLVGITYRQLDYWARTKLILPSMQRETGSGSQRLYSFTDVVQLKVIKRRLRERRYERLERRSLRPVGLA